MSSRLQSSVSSGAAKRDMAQAKQDKKSTQFKTAAAGTRGVTATATGRPSADDIQRMIQEAAYYRAERRGFGCGDDVNDWLEAEAEINARFPQ